MQHILPLNTLQVFNEDLFRAPKFNLAAGTGAGTSVTALTGNSRGGGGLGSTGASKLNGPTGGVLQPQATSSTSAVSAALAPYTLPPVLRSLRDILTFVDSLPPTDSPSVFGQHANGLIAESSDNSSALLSGTCVLSAASGSLEHNKNNALRRSSGGALVNSPRLGSDANASSSSPRASLAPGSSSGTTSVDYSAGVRGIAAAARGTAAGGGGASANSINILPMLGDAPAFHSSSNSALTTDTGAAAAASTAGGSGAARNGAVAAAAVAVAVDSSLAALEAVSRALPLPIDEGRARGFVTARSNSDPPPLSVVFFQEIQGLNALLHTVGGSIVSLRCALQGDALGSGGAVKDASVSVHVVKSQCI